jgi:hypothetical protein
MLFLPPKKKRWGIKESKAKHGPTNTSLNGALADLSFEPLAFFFALTKTKLHYEIKIPQIRSF